MLVNVASQSAFHGSRQLYRQTLRLAAVTAASNDRFFIYAGNAVPSFIISPAGSITAQTGWAPVELLAGSVQLRDTVTPFVRFGNWIVLLAGGVSASVALWVLLRLEKFRFLWYSKQ